MMTQPRPTEHPSYRTKCAASDLLGLSGAIGLLMKGIESRLGEEGLDGVLTEEQEERLRSLFTKLRDAADDVADFARELGEQAR